MRVLIDVKYGEDLIDISYVEKLALFAMKELDLSDTAEVSIAFVDDGEMGDLNYSYRGIEGPTDVLSFECDTLTDDFSVLDPVLLDDIYAIGDIAIAPDVCLRQSDEFGNSFKDELSLLLVHGILHLCGYDHVDDADAEVMEAKQAEILRRWSEVPYE